MPHPKGKNSHDASKQTDASKKASASEPIPVASTALELAANDSVNMSALKDELEKNKNAILTEIKASLAPINSSIVEVNAKLDAFEPRITEMETYLSDHSDRIDSLEKRVDHLEKERGELRTKVEDLENRTRRNNLRVIGLPEGLEGRTAVPFMSQFFVDVLRDESFINPPELERAHRALRPKPAEQEKPRPVIVCFLRFQDKERVLAISRKKGQLSYDGHKVYIFPDLSPGLAKKRAAFNAVKNKLYQKGVKFFLRYPAVLCVTHQENVYKFVSADAAEDFLKRQLLEDD
ncbi:hypothetical protein WMY93_016210 [Mugilogobius chulae]|uniref:L1 transposable element RRM domain-containing protein n=1 Tax=Mugilogobius chulae TaxID=88201 RepID=A0AAW0P4H9_9GOBI